MVWQFLGPIISGMALMWGIYSFIIKRKDEEREREQKRIHIAIENQKAQLEKELYELRSKLGAQQEDLVKMKLSLMGLSVQSKSQVKSFEETIVRWEKTLDRHEAKLDNFGKVIIKEK